MLIFIDVEDITNLGVKTDHPETITLQANKIVMIKDLITEDPPRASITLESEGKTHIRIVKHSRLDVLEMIIRKVRFLKTGSYYHY